MKQGVWVQLSQNHGSTQQDTSLANLGFLPCERQTDSPSMMLGKGKKPCRESPDVLPAHSNQQERYDYLTFWTLIFLSQEMFNLHLSEF